MYDGYRALFKLSHRIPKPVSGGPTEHINILQKHEIYLGKIKLNFLLKVPMHCYMHLVARRTLLSYRD